MKIFQQNHDTLPLTSRLPDTILLKGSRTFYLSGTFLLLCCNKSIRFGISNSNEECNREGGWFCELSSLKQTKEVFLHFFVCFHGLRQHDLFLEWNRWCEGRIVAILEVTVQNRGKWFQFGGGVVTAKWWSCGKRRFETKKWFPDQE